MLTVVHPRLPSPSFFFFTDTATTQIYTLSLHDALPIFVAMRFAAVELARRARSAPHTDDRLFVSHLVDLVAGVLADRKSTRLNSSHLGISYAVFCLKKKKKKQKHVTWRYEKVCYVRRLR